MHTYLHESMKQMMEAFQYDAHPMGMFVGSVAAMSTFYRDAKNVNDPQSRHDQTIRLIAKMPTIAAFSYRHNLGKPYVYPDNDLSYIGNFLSMLWKMSEPKYKPNPMLERPSTCCSSCTRTTSRTAAPTRCAQSAARKWTRTPRSPPRPPRFTVLSTAARTRP